jgi:hypothetical protein
MMMKLPEIKKELKGMDISRMSVVVNKEGENDYFVFLGIHTSAVGGFEDLDLADFESLKDAQSYAKRTATGLNKVWPTKWEIAD